MNRLPARSPYPHSLADAVEWDLAIHRPKPEVQPRPVEGFAAVYGAIPEGTHRAPNDADL